MFAAVVIPLVANGASEAWFGYRDQSDLLGLRLGAEAKMAAAKITAFLGDMTDQLQWTVQRPSGIIGAFIGDYLLIGNATIGAIVLLVIIIARSRGWCSGWGNGWGGVVAWPRAGAGSQLSLKGGPQEPL